MTRRVRGEATGYEGTDKEACDRGDDSRHGELVRTRSRKPQEHDVAGHVGDEHAAQAQITHRVDDAGKKRQNEERRWQWAVGLVGI